MLKTVFNKWVWILIIFLITICVLPILIIWLILFLPSPYNAIATTFIIFSWGIVAGYKEWILFKKKEEHKKNRGF